MGGGWGTEEYRRAVGSPSARIPKGFPSVRCGEVFGHPHIDGNRKGKNNRPSLFLEAAIHTTTLCQLGFPHAASEHLQVNLKETNRHNCGAPNLEISKRHFGASLD